MRRGRRSTVNGRGPGERRDRFIEQVDGREWHRQQLPMVVMDNAGQGVLEQGNLGAQASWRQLSPRGRSRPASEAAECYAESATSLERRKLAAERRALRSALAPPTEGRPDKRTRRLLLRARDRR